MQFNSAKMDQITLEKALEEKCKNQAWLAWMSFLGTSCVMFVSMHLTSYVFLGGNPSFFCDVPELVEANWTKEQIRLISSPGLEKQSCVHYAWNYSLFRDIGFEQALIYFNATPKPNVVKCRNHIFYEEVFHQTAISEWDLVCDNLPLSSTLEAAVAIGKLCGAVTFGLFSDRLGRKTIYVIAWLLYSISGTVAAFVKTYAMFLILRVLTGIAGAGIFDASYTILLELTVKSYRALVANVFNMGFSVGIMYLALAAYLTNDWRQLQLAISVPIFLLIIHCWFYPESPRWLVTNGKFERAAKIIGNKYKLDFTKTVHNTTDNPKSILDKVICIWKTYVEFFSNLELGKRLLILFYTWFIGNLYYFVVALNGSNIEANEYLYVGLIGVIEIPGCLSSILLLKYMGRKSCGILLWTVAGVTLMVTIILPKGWPIVGVSLFGRLVGTGAYSVNMFHTSELFPTEHRNFAIGSCITVSQFGPLLAPYLVDILGKKAWWFPTVLTGSLSLFGAFLLLFLPETRDTPMPDTISEMNLSQKK